MLFIPMEGLTISLLKAEQMETLTSNDVPSPGDLSDGAKIDRLNQYVASDMSENLAGFWGLRINSTEPITADMMQDAWIVLKYELEIN